MFKRSEGKHGQIMTRKEVAVWIGRALSSSEVAMRMILQLSDVIILQQQVIQALYEQRAAQPQGDEATKALEEMEQGLSKKLQGTLGEIRGQLQPILKSLDESCQTLETML